MIVPGLGALFDAGWGPKERKASHGQDQDQRSAQGQEGQQGGTEESLGGPGSPTRASGPMVRQQVPRIGTPPPEPPGLVSEMIRMPGLSWPWGFPAYSRRGDRAGSPLPRLARRHDEKPGVQSTPGIRRYSPCRKPRSRICPGRTRSPGRRSRGSWEDSTPSRSLRPSGTATRILRRGSHPSVCFPSEFAGALKGARP